MKNKDAVSLKILGSEKNQIDHSQYYDVTRLTIKGDGFRHTLYCDRVIITGSRSLKLYCGTAFWRINKIDEKDTDEWRKEHLKSMKESHHPDFILCINRKSGFQFDQITIDTWKVKRNAY